MTWFTFPGWGDYELIGLAEKELVATFAHGYATQAESDKHPNAPPDVEQQALLQLFNAASLDPVGAGIPGVLVTPHSTGGPGGAIKNITKSVLPTFGLSVSGIAGWFVRAMKVVFGGVLIILGISRLTGMDNKIVQLASKIPVVPV